MTVLDPNDPRHGTLGGYTQHRCRCDRCRSARAANQRDLRSRHAGTLAADDPRHGTLNAYVNFDCRCKACGAVHRAYQAGRMYRPALAKAAAAERVRQRRAAKRAAA